MKLSHSKLSCLLTCPMTYYLKYKEGISTIEKAPALSIGSAVHWGIEHNTEDLSEYYSTNGKPLNRLSYTREQLLSEAMVHGYLKHKDEIFDSLLTMQDGSKLKLEDEYHELYLDANLKSFKAFEHVFVGIIDLLLLTDKGFIVIDYKTSTYEPDYNSYLEQIYRYIFLLKSVFPDVPIVKIGIINIKKTGIRQKKGEGVEEFFNRMKFEYDINDENYVKPYEFDVETLDKDRIDRYIENLSKMADTAQLIEDNEDWYINYGNAKTAYGKSEFYDIFYHTPDAHVLYKITDKDIDEDGNVVDERPCRPIDMTVIEDSHVLNKYETFKKMCDAKHITTHPTKSEKDNFVSYLKHTYTCDDYLIGKYFELYSKSL